MHPRSWDVGRRIALVTAVTMFAAACGQARLAAPPDPQFTNGVPAPPVAADPTATTAAPDRVDVEPDTGEPTDVEADSVESIDVDQMVLVDDAGQVAPNRSGWDVFDSSLEQRLIPANVSASVAVMVDGQLVHEAAFGERVAGGGEPVDTTDRFRIASISKTVTAITTLRLVDRGLIGLDDPVGQVLIDHLALDGFDPDVPAITVRKLLSHTAGFPQYEAMFFSAGATSCVDAARQGLTNSVSSGNGFRYSNMSYCVMGVLIEALTGKTYERVVHEELLAPLGIGGMRMSSTYDLGPDEVSHHPTPNRNFMETLGAAGAWNATPSDLATIVNSIDATTPGWKALQPETLAAIRYRVPTGQPASGYGLGVINYDGDAYGHTGTIQNTHAMVLVQPDGVTWALTVSGEYPSNTPQLRSIINSAFAAGFPDA